MPFLDGSSLEMSAPGSLHTWVEIHSALTGTNKLEFLKLKLRVFLFFLDSQPGYPGSSFLQNTFFLTVFVGKYILP
jgi:hypothetical protein